MLSTTTGSSSSLSYCPDQPIRQQGETKTDKKRTKFEYSAGFDAATITDMSLCEVLNLFPHWPLVFRSFLHPPLIARDVVTP